MNNPKGILKGIIYAGLFAVPFIPFLTSGHFFFPYITPKAFSFRIIVEIVLGAWILLALYDPAYRLKKSPLIWALGAFLIIIGLADLFGESPVKSFWSNYERMEGFVTLLHLGAYFLVAGSVLRADTWRYWWNTSLVASFLLSLYTLKEVFGDTVRVSSTIGNASYLAVYLLFHVFFALYMLVRVKKGTLWKWFYWAVVVLDTYVLYYTATRGALLGLVGGLIVLALICLFANTSSKAKKISGAGLILIILLVGGFWSVRNTSLVQESPVLVRFANISTEELKGGGRSFIWPMAIEGIKDKPVLGWGQENFIYIFNERYDPAMYNLEPWFDRAHNIFLDWAVAGGILGLLAYLSLYILVLYMVWKRGEEGETFDILEKAVLTALVSAYFIHNLFVFDHLISYILFFSLLAYVHGKRSTPIGESREFSQTLKNTALPVVLVLLVCTLYFLNIKPIRANTSLLSALRIVQVSSGAPTGATDSFRKAYEVSRLGRPEAVEQMIANSRSVLASSLSEEEKTEFREFASDAVGSLAAEFPGDGRHQLMAGSFFSSIGRHDDAEKYVLRAKELMPRKQAVYFELGNIYLSEGSTTKALSEFKYAYDLAPKYDDAKVVYLIGAIYAGDRELEQRLLSEISPNTLVSDNRIASTYLALGRFSEVVTILRERIASSPNNSELYATLAAVLVRAGNVSEAVSVLREMGEKFPKDKPQADEFIRRIQAGEVR